MTKEKQKIGKTAKHNEEKEEKPKSKIRLFWEKYPNGIGHESRIKMRSTDKRYYLDTNIVVFIPTVER